MMSQDTCIALIFPGIWHMVFVLSIESLLTRRPHMLCFLVGEGLGPESDESAHALNGRLCTLVK
jgi:hypothetical protein